jgi:hypothetical protein
MSDMQRVAGPLFAKMREFDQGLTSLQVDVNSIRNIVDYMKVELDNGIRLFDDDLNEMAKRMDRMMLKLNDQSTNVTNRFDQVDMQRAAGPLFAKMRVIEQKLVSMQLDVTIIENRLKQMVDKDFFDNHFYFMTGRMNNCFAVVDNRFDGVALQVERLSLQLVSQLEEQQRCNRMWFLVIVGINVGTYLCAEYILGTLSYHSIYVPQHCNATNVTGGHRHETVMDRTDLRIIADWFAWLFVRPWMN